MLPSNMLISLAILICFVYCAVAVYGRPCTACSPVFNLHARRRTFTFSLSCRPHFHHSFLGEMSWRLKALLVEASFPGVDFIIFAWFGDLRTVEGWSASRKQPGSHAASLDTLVLVPKDLDFSFWYRRQRVGRFGFNCLDLFNFSFCCWSVPCFICC
jgi:hypothetical protein